MTEPQDPLKLPFGALNNVDEAIGGRRQKVSPDENWLDLVTTAGVNSLIPNVLQGTGPYKAIVLRVESDSSTPEGGNWLSATYDALFGTPPPLVKIKARIPEIHAMLPIPEQTGDAPGPHQPIIDLYPTFIAEFGLMDVPKVGDIVNVDFGNKNTWDDPIYLGPLARSANGAGALGGIAGAGIFGNCGASMPVAPTPSTQTTTPKAGTPPQDTSELTYANPPEHISGYGPATALYDGESQNLLKNLGDKDESQYPLGSVYVFGDSQTNGMTSAILEYFSGFDIKFNNWYGGSYRIAYKDVPPDKAKDKNQGKSIESYMDQYKVGDTIIIGSIGGNISFNAREKYPRVGEAITSDPYLVNLPEKLPTLEGDTFIPTSVQEAAQLAAGEGAAGNIATKYGLGKLIQDGDNAAAFKKFCDILNDIRAKGVNVIIFGLPYGGNEGRQEDRVHFDYVQFASLAAEGLGKNYVSVMQDSKGLKAGENDVHYFTGNGGGGYKPYFETLLNPTLTTFYYTYKQIIKDLIEYARVNTPEAKDQQTMEAIDSGLISLPGEEKPESGILESLDSMLQQAGPPPATPQPTSPALPPTACIGTVGGSPGGGSASGGKSFGVDPSPFNGGQTNVIVIGGQSYPVDFAVVGSQQFEGQQRKGNPTYVVIHNSAGSSGQEKVWKSLLKDGYGVHFTIGLDGVVYQHGDPITQLFYHASGINDDSIGIEIPMRFYGPPGSAQAQAGFTVAKQGVWWASNSMDDGQVYIGKDKQTGVRKYRTTNGFTVPPQKMVDANNKLLAFLSAKIPSITPGLTTFPSNYPGPEKLRKRQGSVGVKMWNKGGSWSSPVPSKSGPFKGSLLSHRDWSAKVDGRYFLEKFYEYYTGTKLDGIFRE
jgi:hypothetical protein